MPVKVNKVRGNEKALDLLRTPWVSSGIVATTPVKESPGLLGGIYAWNDGSETGIVQVYDTPNAPSSANLLFEAYVLTTSPTQFLSWEFPFPGVEFTNGIYVKVTGVLTVMLVYR